MHRQRAILDWRIRSRVDFLEHYVHTPLVVAIMLRPKLPLCCMHKRSAKLFLMVAVETADVIIGLLGGG